MEKLKVNFQPIVMPCVGPVLFVKLSCDRSSLHLFPHLSLLFACYPPALIVMLWCLYSCLDPADLIQPVTVAYTVGTR